MQLGASHLQRDLSTARDVRTETALAFIALSRGFSERWEFGVLLPYILYSEQIAVNGSGRTVREEHSDGIGNPTLRSRYALKREDASIAVTFGLLATLDWGGQSRSFNGQAESVEPFVVLGRSLGASKAYLRYGYMRRSGDSPDAHHFTVGGRRPFRAGFGAIGHVSYVRSLGSATADGRATLGAAIGGYAGLPNGMQLLGWLGTSGFAESNGAESHTRQIAFSLVHRF